MERSSDAFIASGLAQTQNCVSCHHQSLTAIAANWANARGIRPDLASLQRNLDATLRMLEPRIPKCYEGILPAPNPGIENGYMLMHLEALGHPADAVTDALVWQLAASQKPDRELALRLHPAAVGARPHQGDSPGGKIPPDLPAAFAAEGIGRADRTGEVVARGAPPRSLRPSWRFNF